MRRAGHVACIEKRRVLIGLWWGNPKERDHLKNLDEEYDIKLYIQELGWEHGLD